MENRRNFIKKTVLSIAAITVARSLHAKQSDENILETVDNKTFEFGLASYTTREFTFEQTLQIANKLGLKKLICKSMHLPLDATPEQLKAAQESARNAGINLYGAGVIYMKTKEEVEQAFTYAQNAGLSVIIGVPAHDMLQLVEAKVKETGIKVAVHNHGPEDKMYPTPQSVMDKIATLDSRISMCLDIGHCQRSGIDPTEAFLKFKSRITELHIKDVDKAEEKGTTIEMGRGIINIPKLLKVILKNKYTGNISFEYEKDGKDPIPGLAIGVGYVNGILDILAKK